MSAAPRLRSDRGDVRGVEVGPITMEDAIETAHEKSSDCSIGSFSAAKSRASNAAERDGRELLKYLVYANCQPPFWILRFK